MENTQTKNWLQRLKDESWEAELLVSIASIFAIFKSFAIFDWVCDMFIDMLNPSQYSIGYMITLLGFLAFGILGALFVIHFALRAYWIGLVGLNSVFPDYSIQDSAYSKTFTEKMLQKLPKIQNTIKSLDEICSVIFSAAFTLLLIYSYAGLFSAIYLLLFNLLSDKISIYILLIPLVLFLIVYFIQMMLTIVANLKKYKQNSKIQTWYYNSTIWGSAILYGPLYKNLLQVTMIFGSNFKKKKALVRIMLFMLILGAILGMFKMFQSNIMVLMGFDKKDDITRVYQNFYNTYNTDQTLLLTPEIQSEIITDKTIKLFVPILNHESNFMEKDCKLDKIEYNKESDTWRQERWNNNLDCYSSNIKVILDDVKINSEFLKTDHPITNQFGLIGFIDLSNMPTGKHTLKIEKKVSADLVKNWEIPFYLSPK